jgi:hypothetical protein
MRQLNTLQEISLFDPQKLDKNPTCGIFALMSNLTKMPFWTSDFNTFILIKSFWLVFLIGFFIRFSFKPIK